jgi:hypothetical protein
MYQNESLGMRPTPLALAPRHCGRQPIRRGVGSWALPALLVGLSATGEHALRRTFANAAKA